MMSERIILQCLIGRLVAHIGEAKRMRMSWWGDHQPPELIAASRSGQGRLEHALRYAQDAIASGDEGRIVLASKLCPMWERDGLKQKQIFAEVNRRKSGGAKRGKQQSAEAAKEWEPWIKRFRELTAAGRKETMARTIVKKEMTAAPFILSATGEFPSDRSIRDRLK